MADKIHHSGRHSLPPTVPGPPSYKDPPLYSPQGDIPRHKRQTEQHTSSNRSGRTTPVSPPSKKSTLEPRASPSPPSCTNGPASSSLEQTSLHTLDTPAAIAVPGPAHTTRSHTAARATTRNSSQSTATASRNCTTATPC